MIAAWKLDLNRILQVFNVSFAAVVWLSLTGHSQTELTMVTHVIVSDIHHNMLNRQGGTDDQHQLVSSVYPLLHHRINKQLSQSRLKSGWRS